MKLLFKPVSILVSVLGGIVAGAIFKQVWKLARHEEEAPKPTDIQRGWGEVLVAAALHGAIFALVRAALDRGVADAIMKLTGFWPGTDSEAEAKKEAERAKEKAKA